MKRNQEQLKTKLIKLLNQFPVVTTVCKQAGVSRATYYRWLKEDKDFANAINEAVTIGVESVNDIAETQLFVAIKTGEPWALRFWLNNRSPHYATPNRLIREIHHTKTMISQASDPDQPPVALVRFMEGCEHCIELHKNHNHTDAF